MAGEVNRLVVGGNIHDKSESIPAAHTDAADAAGDPPTQVEFNALVDRYNALATSFNSLLDVLAENGVILEKGDAPALT